MSYSVDATLDADRWVGVTAISLSQHIPTAAKHKACERLTTKLLASAHNDCIEVFDLRLLVLFGNLTWQRMVPTAAGPRSGAALATRPSRETILISPLMCLLDAHDNGMIKFSCNVDHLIPHQEPFDSVPGGVMFPGSVNRRYRYSPQAFVMV